MTTSTAGKRNDAPALRAYGVAGWLCLAAAPTFAGMAWLAAGGATPLCTSGPSMLPMDGMTSMYLLMSLFHLPPWLRLASACGATAHRPRNPNAGD
jgi:hypothetical protein